MTMLAVNLRLAERRTFVRIAGEGPPVVLIHGGGLGSSGHVWTDVVPHLATAHRVIVPDLIGFGGSAAGDVEDGMPLFIRQVAELLDVLCLDHPVVVGHSMGCQIATSIALRFPERIAALGLLAGGGRFVGLVYESAGHALLKRLVADPTEAGMRGFVECVNGRLDDIEAEVAERMRWAANPDHLAAQRKLNHGRQQPGRGLDYTGLDRLPMPIAFGWGELERFNPVQIGPQIVARLPHGTRYDLFRGAGHNIPHDRPEDTAQFIAELAERGLARNKPAEKIAAG